MADARLILLGPPRLECTGAAASLTSRKGLALLAYLALNGRRQPRGTLAELLWPDRPRANALTNLRRTLHRVRAALPTGTLASPDGALELRTRDLWVDVWAFREAVRGLPPAGESTVAALEAVNDAVSLSGGTLLQGLDLPDCPAFEAWLSLEREAHHHAVASALERLGEASLSRGDPAAALRAGQRWTALRPFSEAGYRLVMRAHAALGDTAAALDQYRRCRAILEQELGAVPDAATEELRRSLRAGTPAPAGPRASPSPEVRYAWSGDVHIAFQVVGRGPVDLLLAPGFISHLDHLWRHPPLRASLQHLAERFRLILFDRRGVGLSERVGAPPTLYATARDMETVLRAAGSPGAVLFGFSECGPAAMLFAALHPQRVRGLVLYATMAKGLRAPDYPWAPDERQFELWLDELVSQWGKPVPHEAFAPTYRNDSALWTWFAEMMRLGSSPAGMRAVLGALRQLDARALLPHVSVPTLLLHRNGDRLIHVGAGRYLAAHLPSARYIELDGADHWWWLGQRDAFLGPVEAFVAEAPRRAQAGSLTTVLCQGGEHGVGSRAFPEPLAALEAISRPSDPMRPHQRAVIHCGAPSDDPEGTGRRLLADARPGEVLVTRRVRDIAASVGYAFTPRAASGTRPSGGGVWALNTRPA